MLINHDLMSATDVDNYHCYLVSRSSRLCTQFRQLREIKLQKILQLEASVFSRYLDEINIKQVKLGIHILQNLFLLHKHFSNEVIR